MYSSLSVTNFEGYCPTVMKFLWKEYGLTFPNESLMSAVLAVQIGPYEGKFGEGASYIERFRNLMIKSIETQNLSECHLFGIFFVGFICSLHEMWTHLRGFEAVLRFLIENHPNLQFARARPSLRHILAYMIVQCQRQAVRTVSTVPVDDVYIFVRKLGQLSCHFRNPLQFFDFQAEYALLTRGLPDYPSINWMGGLLTAIDEVQVHLFQFAYETRRANVIVQGAIAKLRSLQTAERKLEQISNSTMVLEIFRFVQNLILDVLTE